MQLVPLSLADRPALSALLRRIPHWRPEKLAIAEAMLEDSLRGPRGTGFETIVALDEKHVIGYVCFGRAPMTQSTWDLRWIVVDPAWQGQGIGKQLFGAFSERAIQQGGTQARVETSSENSVAGTTVFYARVGFRCVAVLEDFYGPSDNQLIYYRTL